MNKFYKIFSNCIIIFLSIIVCILLISFFQVNVLNNAYSNIFGYTIFEVATGSMEPTIMTEDIIIVKLNDNYSENDIITYKSENEFVTHRVTEVQDSKVITKGDNNNAEDDPVEKSDVIGKVVFVFKDVSIWKRVFKDYRVIIQVTITIILFISIILYKEKNDK